MQLLPLALMFVCAACGTTAGTARYGIVIANPDKWHPNEADVDLGWELAWDLTNEPHTQASMKPRQPVGLVETDSFIPCEGKYLCWGQTSWMTDGSVQVNIMRNNPCILNDSLVHEFFHIVLHQVYGNADAKHEHSGWARLATLRPQYTCLHPDDSPLSGVSRP